MSIPVPGIVTPDPNECATEQRITITINLPILISFDWIVKGINAVALGVTTAVQIKNIDKTQFDGGGSSGSTAAPVASAAAPTVPSIAKTSVPQIQGTSGGNNPTSQIAQTLSKASDKPVKAYVVSGDISSQQALDRRTNRAATFAGG